MENAQGQVTRLLQAAGEGDRRALDDLVRVTYQELRSLANAWLARMPAGQTLQPTALVNEAFARLVGRDALGWANRAHFFYAAGRAMRDVLVENARSKARLKRGGGRKRVDLEGMVLAAEVPGDDLLVLNDALERFEREYPWESRIVMLRFFAGLTNEEAANSLGISLRTLERDWRFARTWLRNALRDEGDGKADGSA